MLKQCTEMLTPDTLLDRLTHRVHILEANDPSYRLRESKRRLQKPDSKGTETKERDQATEGPDPE